MKYPIYFILLFSIAVSGCKKVTDDFLTQDPLDKFQDDTYWTSEDKVRTYAYGFYTTYFPGYASGFDLTWGGYFSGESLNDDFAPTTPTVFTRTVPNSGGGWTFTNIRRANIMIDRVKRVPMGDAALKHWTGIGRFFRAMDFASKVRRFGDYPYYGKEVEESDIKELYKPRDPRTLVMDSVLADFKYAAENVRAADGVKGLEVNKFVVLAFMSRVFLYEGTWQKYQANNMAKAQEYLEAAKFAANEVMTKGGYTVAPDYRKIFNSLDLSGNPEIILYRSYIAGVLTHSLNSYVNKEPQAGASKNAVETYLCSDGLPIGLSPAYKGDKTIENVMASRDPRINATFVTALRLNGINGNYSSSGYAVHKFLNEEIKDQNEGNSNLNITDAPVIRYGEVLMNYAEAVTELGNLTQADLDKSINLLRKRTGINMPSLQVIGNQPAVNGVVYNDPKHDPSISSLLWEIRRERRVELMMEGFRNDDLKRWKKYEYLDTQKNSDINRGAWLVRSQYPKATASIESNATAGYIIPATKAETQRIFSDPKVYLFPLPLDQIRLYKDQGTDLKQNPGW